MSMFDNLGDKAKEAAGEHQDQIDEGIEKAGDFADEKTGGKFSDQIDQGQDQASEFVQGLGNEDEQQQ